MNRATLQTLFEERLDYINDELFVCTALLFKVHSTRQSLIISDKISELIYLTENELIRVNIIIKNNDDIVYKHIKDKLVFILNKIRRFEHMMFVISRKRKEVYSWSFNITHLS